MAAVTIATSPNLHSGEPWSEMDVFDPRSHLAPAASVEETSMFLRREADEVHEKAYILRLIVLSP
jgi:hypothetical protein